MPFIFWFFAALLLAVVLFIGDNFTLAIYVAPLIIIGSLVIYDRFHSRHQKTWKQKILFDKNKPENIWQRLADLIH
jgi:small basic protein